MEMPRPAGIPKTGGRKRGVPNKATAAREAEIKAAGVSPLDFMLGVMRNDTNATEMRLEAAAKAAPYVHPRLASLAVENKGNHPFRIDIEDREREAEARAARARAILKETFDGLSVHGAKASDPANVND